MSQFPEISSNLSTANFRASVLTMLQALYTNANTETPPVISGGIAGTTSVTAGSVNAYVVNTIDTATLGFSTTTTATGGTISIYGSVDGVNYLPTSYAALSSGNSSGTFNAATQTIGQINCVGLVAIAFKANAVTGGSVVVTTVGTNAVSNVMLDNALPTGANVIGVVGTQAANGTMVFGGGTAPTGTAGFLSGASITPTKSLSIQNNALTGITITISTSTTPSTTNGIVLASGATYNFPYLPSSPLYVLGSAANAVYSVWYA